MTAMFPDRKTAGKLLGEKLATRFSGANTVVCGLPRGGVVTAAEVAKELKAPLSVSLARKIGYPGMPEYAIAAVTDTGQSVANEVEVQTVPKDWLNAQLITEQKEAKRHAEVYTKDMPARTLTGRIILLVDDGVATGLTLRAAIRGVRTQKPARIVVAVPVVSHETAEILRKEADEVVALIEPKGSEFLGAVGAYYEAFPQVSEQEVRALLQLSLKT